ncbi:MAG: hypothetical protein ACXW0Z_17545 [Gemmatirosa sp.]
MSGLPESMPDFWKALGLPPAFGMWQSFLRGYELGARDVATRAAERGDERMCTEFLFDAQVLREAGRYLRALSTARMAERRPLLPLPSDLIPWLDCLERHAAELRIRASSGNWMGQDTINPAGTDRDHADAFDDIAAFLRMHAGAEGHVFPGPPWPDQEGFGDAQ